MAWSRRQFVYTSTLGSLAFGLTGCDNPALKRLYLFLGGGICFVTTRPQNTLEGAMLRAEGHTPVLSLLDSSIKRISPGLRARAQTTFRGHFWWPLDNVDVTFRYDQPQPQATVMAESSPESTCPTAHMDPAAWKSFKWVGSLLEIAPEFRPNPDWATLPELVTKVALTGGAIEGFIPSPRMHCVWQFPAPPAGTRQPQFTRALTDIALFRSSPAERLVIELRPRSNAAKCPPDGCDIEVNLPAVGSLTYLPLERHGVHAPRDEMTHFAMFKLFLKDCYDDRRLIPHITDPCNRRQTIEALRLKPEDLDLDALAKYVLRQEITSRRDVPTILKLKAHLIEVLSNLIGHRIDDSGHCAGASIEVP